MSLARWVTLAPSIINTARNGYKLMQEYLEPGKYAAMAREATAVAIAGGRAKRNTVEIKPLAKAINSFRNGAILKGVTQVPAAVLSTLSAPLMEYYVPWMKFGIFYGLAHDIIEEAERGNISRDQMRSRLNEAWDSVDNRAGQMVYENLFWNKAVRDVVQVATRSVGWNYGSYREAFGAATGTVRAAATVLSGKKPRLTPAMAFALALPMTTAMIGGTANYMRTGKAPATAKDYFFIKNSDGTYLNIPGYMKDAFAFAHSPVATIANKLGPLWESSVEMLENRDFYGTEIRHKDDSLVQQMVEVAEWAAKQALPFSISGAGKLLEDRGSGPSLGEMIETAIQHPGDLALAQLGFNKAPSYIQNSPAVELAHEYQLSNRPPGTRTKEQAEHLTALHQVRTMYRTNTVNQKQIDKFIADGTLTERDVAKAEEDADIQPIVHAVQGLGKEQFLNVYEKASPEERESLERELSLKEQEIERMPDGEEQDRLRKAYDRVTQEKAPPSPL
jgi:hypothetical protein